MPHSTVWPSSTTLDNPQHSHHPPHPPTPSDSSTKNDHPPTDTTPFPPVPLDDSSANIHIAGKCPCVAEDSSALGHYRRRQSQQSGLAKFAMAAVTRQTGETKRKSSDEGIPPDEKDVDQLRNQLDRTLTNGSSSTTKGESNGDSNGVKKAHFEAPAKTDMPRPAPVVRTGSLAAALNGAFNDGAIVALNDTPTTTAPSSPRMYGLQPLTAANNTTANITLSPPLRQGSGSLTPRVRPTTLDIPGLTKSKVSPDGRIAQRDLGSKLVIVMVGLPARGKSYITKKLARYLNWLQHDTKIFNVGARRRVAAGGPNTLEKTTSNEARAQGRRASLATVPTGYISREALLKPLIAQQPASVAQILLNGQKTNQEAPGLARSNSIQYTPTELEGRTAHDVEKELEKINMEKLESKFPELMEAQKEAELQGVDNPEAVQLPEAEVMDQSAAFFDPANKKASLIREQVAMETLDELLHYILEENGSIGILDATNSTLERRKMVMRHIRERAGPELNVLFLESKCENQDLLEANMRLKLNGPDYKDMDPTVALEDFKKRVQVYEKAYVSLGEYEEQQNFPYIQMIDVGRKIISHQIKGFLSAQANYYLLNFNLAPRQIWITRHGTSLDNLSGKIGGDSDLAPEGHEYARCLVRFIDQKRHEWDLKQIENHRNTHFPPQPGDATPPNPHYQPQSPSATSAGTLDPLSEYPEGYQPQSFCVWTSMLKRSIQTAQYFNDEDYDTKQMRMLDELNAGVMEGLTYSCISTQYPEEYRARKQDKLHYRYPGPGGEGYLDIINRLRPVIVELERMTDHVLLVGHRSVARVLLAYFRGLNREEVADVDVPLGMLYCLEPKPYGVDFKAYKWDKSTEWFYEQPNFELRRAEDDMK